MNESDNDKSDIQIDDPYIASSRKDTPIKLNFEEIRIPDVTANVYDTGENIDSGEHQNPIIPKKTNLIPSGVSGTDSVMDEVEIPDITVNLSNEDKIVNMDEGILAIETLTSSIISTSIITTCFINSCFHYLSYI